MITLSWAAIIVSRGRWGGLSRLRLAKTAASIGTTKDDTAATKEDDEEEACTWREPQEKLEEEENVK